MIKKNHPFHIVEISPWPIIASLLSLCLTSALIIIIHKILIQSYFTSVIIIFLISFIWWINVSQEALSQGVHIVQRIKNLKIGIILFITSEIIFFFSFFWAYFHSSISPRIEIGVSWPPLMISSFNPINIPLLNTIVLLSSGISITWAHHRILNNKFNQANISIILTIVLGGYFTLLQLFEYSQGGFSIADSSYGSTFFMATGFHGLHVIIGSIFIGISWKRLSSLIVYSSHIIGFETSAWYWHFVDVVWLFLYSSIYWWGTNYFYSI